MILPSGEHATQMLQQTSSVVMNQATSPEFLSPGLLNDSSNIGPIINDSSLQRTDIPYSDAKRIRMEDVSICVTVYCADSFNTSETNGKEGLNSNGNPSFLHIDIALQTQCI